MTNLLCGADLHDMVACYKLIPTRRLRDLDIKCNRFDMEPEITAKLLRRGCRIHEVPVAYSPQGDKKLSARRDGLPAVLGLLRYGIHYQQFRMNWIARAVLLAASAAGCHPPRRLVRSPHHPHLIRSQKGGLSA